VKNVNKFELASGVVTGVEGGTEAGLKVRKEDHDDAR